MYTMERYRNRELCAWSDTTKKAVVCPNCNRPFATRANLGRHFKRAVCTEFVGCSSCRGTSVKNDHRCDICTFTFESNAALVNHRCIDLLLGSVLMSTFGEFVNSLYKYRVIYNSR